MIILRHGHCTLRSPGKHDRLECYDWRLERTRLSCRVTRRNLGVSVRRIFFLFSPVPITRSVWFWIVSATRSFDKSRFDFFFFRSIAPPRCPRSAILSSYSYDMRCVKVSKRKIGWSTGNRWSRCEPTFIISVNGVKRRIKLIYSTRQRRFKRLRID